MRPPKPRTWFADQIRELGELLKRMPEARRDSLWRTIGDEGNTEAAPDDRTPGGRPHARPNESDKPVSEK